MKRFKTLDKGWKEILFAASGLGPNLLMILMGAFYTDAVNPAALGNASAVQSIAGVCLVVPALFPILFLIAKPILSNVLILSSKYIICVCIILI